MEASSQKAGETQQSTLNMVLVVWEEMPEGVHFFLVPESKIGRVTRELMNKNANGFINSDCETEGLRRLYDAFFFNPKKDKAEYKCAKKAHNTDGKYRRFKTKPPLSQATIVAVYRFGTYL